MRFVGLPGHWLPVSLYAIFVFIVSSIPRPLRVLPLFPHSDKVSHFIIYAVFAFLMVKALYRSRPDMAIFRLKLTAFTLVFIYGVMIEVWQYFLPVRSMEILDILANGLGALAVLLFFKIK
jgi:VanZ family protein